MRFSSFAVVVGCLASLLGASEAHAQATRRATFNQHGDITIASNAILTCTPGTRAGGAAAGTTCEDALLGLPAGASPSDNDFNMIPIDTDGDATTFDSSSADVVLPAGASVTWAGLYWQCFSGGAPTPASRNRVSLRGPGAAAYTSYTGTVATIGGGGAGLYQGFVEVTTDVARSGAGTYTAANIQCDSGTANHFGGWSLVVIYANAPDPLRNLVVFDTFRQYGNAAGVLDVPITGFLTPPTGAVTSRVGVVIYDGDRHGGPSFAAAGSGNDTVTLISGALTTVLGETPGPTAVNPSDDFGNGSVTRFGANVTTRSPASINTLGFDSDLFGTVDALPNSATTATVRFTATGETIDVGVMTFATDIFAPDLAITKTVTDVNGGNLVAGDVLQYAIGVMNTGSDPALDVRLTDVIPVGTTYVPGTLFVNGTLVSDMTDGDVGEFIAGTTTVSTRLGTGATGVLGGRMNTGASATIAFQVRTGMLPAGTTIRNTAVASYTGLTLGPGTTFTGDSDGDPTTGGIQPTVITFSPICGDGTISAPETCDDTNTTSGDGCSAGCRREVQITSPRGITTNDSTPTVTGTADPGATVTVSIDGTVIGMATADAAGNWSLTPTTPLADGLHNIGASARDSLGATSTDASTVTVDTMTAVTITQPASGSSTNDTTPDIRGTGEPGAMVQVLVDGVAVGTATVAADGTWTVTVTTPLAAGPHTTTANATDARGNTATAMSSFSVDTSTTVSITGPAMGSTVMTATPPITGMGEPGATVVVTVDGAVIGMATVAADGTWTVTPTMPLGNGPHTAVATATDAAGNTATATSMFNVMAGTFVNIAMPADGSSTADSTPTISGTGTPGDTVMVLVDGVSVGMATVAADGTWSVTPTTPLSEGMHSVTANARNARGDTATDTNMFSVDSSTVVDFLQPGDHGAIGDSTPELSGTAEPGDTVQVTLDGTVIGTVTADREGNWTLVVPAPLADGVHNVSVRATDAAGNTATDMGPFTVDTMAPALEIRGPGDNTHTSDTTPTVSGDTEPGLLVIVLIDGVMVGTVTADARGHWSLDLTTPLSAGAHQVQATTTDAAGNTANDVHHFTVDTMAPAVDVMGPADGSTTRDTTPTLSGTAEPMASVQVFVDGALVGTVTAAADGTWSIDATTLADGPHTVRAVAEDAAGNTATDSGAFTVDTATTVAITRPANGTTIGSARPQLSGTAEPGDMVVVSVDGVVVGTVTASADGTWTIPTTTDLTAGMHTVTARATDAAGNTADASSTFTYNPAVLDTDGDGIVDTDECPSMPCRDTDMDGMPDFMDPDDDGDGIPTAIECGTTPCPDHDGDGIPDYLDPDDDGDGILTRNEAPMGVRRDTDLDGLPDYLDVDDDGDGLLTMAECPMPAMCPDHDTDGRPDYIDPDDDNDTIPTARERADGMMFGNDVDGDGTPNYLDTESDGDGMPDMSEGVGDRDGDGIPNYLDPRDNPGDDGGVRDAGARDAGDAGARDGSAADTGAGPHAPGGFAGGACNCSVPGAPASRSGGGVLLALLGLALAWRRRRRAVLSALITLVLLGGASSASAQGFTLDQFRPAETSNDGFAISRPNDLGHLNLGAQLVLDYAHDPLVYEERLGDQTTQSRRIVEHQLLGTIGLSLGLFDRLVIYAGLPVSLFSQGSGGPGFPVADGTAVGDPYLGLRVRLFGEANDVFALGVQLGLTAPLGDLVQGAQSFTGERGFAFLPRLMGEIRLADGRVRIGLNLGGRFRDSSQVLNLTVSHELTYGLGVTGVLVPGVLDVLLEGFGATSFDHFFERENTPFEILGGPRIHPICGLTIGAAVGGGLTRGYGAPNVRAVLSVGYAFDASCATPAPVVEGDVAPPAPGDRDGDGILDVDDACPAEPEDVDTWEDSDGCPDPDNDSDVCST